MKILVNSSIRDLDSKGMNLSAKAGAARPQETGRHTISKFRRAVKVKITIKDRKRGNMAAEFKGEKTVSERRRTYDTKSFRLHSVQESCMCGASPHMSCVLHTRADKAFLYGHQLCGGEKLAETIQNAQLRGS